MSEALNLRTCGFSRGPRAVPAATAFSGAGQALPWHADGEVGGGDPPPAERHAAIARHSAKLHVGSQSASGHARVPIGKMLPTIACCVAFAQVILVGLKLEQDGVRDWE